jgi:ATP-dependent exoDNAse (exonuclease V) beta subunit
MVEPEKTSFEQLKVFSSGKLWKDNKSPEHMWVDTVQYKRNAIHAFRYRNIGTAHDFLEDIDHLYNFVDNVLSHLPPLEDVIDVFPAGYEMNPYFE